MTTIDFATWSNYCSCQICAGDDPGGTLYLLLIIQGQAWITMREDGSAVSSGTSETPVAAVKQAIIDDGVWDIGDYVPDI